LMENNETALSKKSLVKHWLYLADEMNAAHVLVFTTTGNLAKLVSAFKPNQQIFACCPDQKIVNWMNILAGIQWIKMDEWKDHTSENQELALKILKERNLISYWEKIIIIWAKRKDKVVDPLIRISVVE
jgi:pyruvate kinase